MQIFGMCCAPTAVSFFLLFFYRYFLAYNVHVHRTASHNICRESTQFFADFAKAVQTKLYSLPTIWYELENRDLFIKRSPLPLMFCSKWGKSNTGLKTLSALAVEWENCFFFFAFYFGRACDDGDCSEWMLMLMFFKSSSFISHLYDGKAEFVLSMSLVVVAVYHKLIWLKTHLRNFVSS